MNLKQIICLLLLGVAANKTMVAYEYQIGFDFNDLNNREHGGLVSYWKQQGLSDDEANRQAQERLAVPANRAQLENILANLLDNQTIKVTHKYYWALGGKGEEIIEFGKLPGGTYLGGIHDNSGGRGWKRGFKLGVWHDFILPEGGLWAFEDNNGKKRYNFHVPGDGVASGYLPISTWLPPTADGIWQAKIVKLDAPLPRELWGKNQLAN